MNFLERALFGCKCCEQTKLRSLEIQLEMQTKIRKLTEEHRDLLQMHQEILTKYYAALGAKK